MRIGYSGSSLTRILSISLNPNGYIQNERSKNKMDIGAYAPEKVAFIAYNIGIYESIQKFASLILAGKIDRSLDTNKIAELLSETVTFYDADMISQLINILLGSNSKSPVGRVDTDEVNYVIDQLKACGISLP